MENRSSIDLIKAGWLFELGFAEESSYSVGVVFLIMANVSPKCEGLSGLRITDFSQLNKNAAAGWRLYSYMVGQFLRTPLWGVRLNSYGEDSFIIIQTVC